MMCDIVKAIEKEKEYLAYRMKGEEPFHLVDAIKDCGFESLRKYFDAKKDYEFNNTKFRVIDATSPELCVKDIFNVISNKEDAIIFVDIDYTVVWYQINSNCNFEYCIKNKIPMIPTSTDRGVGALVSTPNDFGVGICIHRNDKYNLAYFLNGFVDIFKKYTNKNVWLQDNDIMYEGKKVCGFTWYDINNMLMIITPISFSEKSELVSTICNNKPQVKQVGYIDFMDREMFKQEVQEWLRV